MKGREILLGITSICPHFGAGLFLAVHFWLPFSFLLFRSVWILLKREKGELGERHESEQA